MEKVKVLVGYCKACSNLVLVSVSTPADIDRTLNFYKQAKKENWRTEERDLEEFKQTTPDVCSCNVKKKKQVVEVTEDDDTPF